MTLRISPPPSVENNGFERNFHETFMYFARAQNGDNLIQGSEFEQRILEKLDDYRRSNSKFNPAYDPSRIGKRSINFKEFGVLRDEFGLPFANKDLGYYLKNAKHHNVNGGCGITSQSDVSGLEGELSISKVLQRLGQQIEQYTGANISAGVSETVLKQYYDRRTGAGLKGPEYITNNWLDADWSTPYDVGAGGRIYPCPKNSYDK